MRDYNGTVEEQQMALAVLAHDQIDWEPSHR